MQKGLSIGAVARQVGVRPSTLRYYESIGLLPAPKRVRGRRQYGAEVLQRLALIRAAKRAGFGMAEIRTLLQGFTEDAPVSARWRPLAETKIAEMNQRIQEAEAMKRVLEAGLQCECATLNECVILTEQGCSDEPFC